MRIMRKRMTIGLLLGNIEDDYNNAFSKGAMRAAEELDCNLVLIPGKYFGNVHEDPMARYEYQYNAMFSYVEKGNIDAIIVCLGIIGPFSDKKRGSREEFLSMLEGIPMVTVSEKVEGSPCIKYDNQVGIKEGIRHLIRERNCQHIAMITGQKDNEDAMERLLAYKEALLEEDMEIDEDLIRYGDFTIFSEEIVKELIKSNPEMDAIVFGNDLMAFGGYQALKEMELSVGKDIAFMGFDDIPQAISMDPPLATVRAGIENIGYESVQMAYRYQKEGTAEDISLPTQFILRESMGQNEENSDMVEDLLAKAHRGEKSVREVGEALFFCIVDNIIDRGKNEKAWEMFYQLWEEVEKIYEKTECEEGECVAFLNKFMAFIKQDFMKEMDLNKVVKIFDCGCKVFFYRVKTEQSRLYLASEISFCYRKMLETQTAMATQNLLEQRNAVHVTNVITKGMFSFENGSEQSYQYILENLYLLGIRRTYLMLYDNPITNLQGDRFEMPSKVNLVAVQNGNSVTILPQKKQVVLKSDLFWRCTKDKERVTLSAIALFVNEVQYGLMLCEIPYEHLRRYELLNYQSSITIKMIQLLRQENETQKQLEESMTLLRDNNIHLDTISKRDELTGILNRRGFMASALTLLQEESNLGRYVITAYADTDNLKIINDRYGHEEGDFALVSSSDILRNAFEENGIVGRIGGDEFAAMMVTDSLEEENRVRQQIVSDLETLNAESGKPYIVSISVGIAYAKIKKEMEIRDLLERADALLYKEKKNRKKEVSKDVLE